MTARDIENNPERLCDAAQILLRAIVLSTIHRDGPTTELLRALRDAPASSSLSSLSGEEAEAGLAFLRRLGFIAPRRAELHNDMPIRNL